MVRHPVTGQRVEIDLSWMGWGVEKHSSPLEFDGIKHLVTAGSIALVIVVNTLTVLYRGSSKVSHINDWYALADIVCNAGMPKNVCVQWKRTVQYHSHFLQPSIYLADEVLYVTIVYHTIFQSFLAPDREYIAVLAHWLPALHNISHNGVDRNGAIN